MAFYSDRFAQYNDGGDVYDEGLSYGAGQGHYSGGPSNMREDLGPRSYASTSLNSYEISNRFEEPQNRFVPAQSRQVPIERRNLSRSYDSLNHLGNYGDVQFPQRQPIQGGMRSQMAPPHYIDVPHQRRSAPFTPKAPPTAVRLERVWTPKPRVQRTEPEIVQVKKPPPPKVFITNAKTLALQIKRLEGCNEPIIGLKFVTEFLTEYDDGQSVHYYRCNLCEVSGDAPNIIKHIIDYPHRTKYIDHFKLEPANDKKDIARRAAAIETVHGRGQWIVEKEKKVFVPAEATKKRPHVAVAPKPSTSAAAQDVEMTDVEKKKPKVEPSTPKTVADDLREGEIVIDEAISEDAPDAKLFVLTHLNGLVSKDFRVRSETELAIVDSIITHMRKAVVLYQKRRNMEEAGVPFDDGEELDVIDEVQGDRGSQQASPKPTEEKPMDTETPTNPLEVAPKEAVANGQEQDAVVAAGGQEAVAETSTV